MNRFAVRLRSLLLALAALTLPAAADAAAVRADDPPTLRLTSRDLDETTAKVEMAYGALVDMWGAQFRELGARFTAPRIVRHRSAVRTSCGIVPASNASYCASNNTIYFDDVFLAAQARLTGHALGTDGDMAAVGIIAHEMGHAVAFQLGLRSRQTYVNEAIADCLTGAFARESDRQGFLEEGDLDEAFLAMASAGDPELELTGNRRVDSRRAARLARAAHGTRDQRQQNFQAGYERGARGCLSGFRPAA
jgi:uncharacterized protein